MIFDTHIHLNDDTLLNDIDSLINNAKEKGVNKFLCVGFDINSSKKAIELANKYDCIYATIGIIPTEHKQYNENSIKELEELLLTSNKIVAIGEIGLDYWENEQIIKDKQKEIISNQEKYINENSAKDLVTFIKNTY